MAEPSEPDAQSPDDEARAALSRGVAALDPPVFAVLDGGLFDDLPGLLKAAGFSHRSLFLDHADAEIERAGPWLAALPEEGDAARLPNVDGAAPAVFWAGAPDELALHRHLRTLNLARIPDWAAEGREAPPGDADVYATVMFRHWDASVLGDFLPVLHEDQLARVLGPAEALAFLGEDGRMKRLASDPAWPPPAPGMLTITSAQIAALERAREVSYNRWLSGYLRRNAPFAFAGRSDEDIASHLARCRETAAALGITTQRGVAKWSYLMTMTKGDIASADAVRGLYSTAPEISADRKTDILMRAVIRSAGAR